jgi:hypothetical protein
MEEKFIAVVVKKQNFCNVQCGGLHFGGDKVKSIFAGHGTALRDDQSKP